MITDEQWKELKPFLFECLKIYYFSLVLIYFDSLKNNAENLKVYQELVRIKAIKVSLPAIVSHS